MNYQMSLDPVDQPLAIKDKAVVEDKGEGEDEDEELDSEPAGRSGSVGHPESADLLSSTSQPVSDQNYISYDQAFVAYACTFTVGELGAGCRDSSCSAR
jgi:hypothetical protein